MAAIGVAAAVMVALVGSIAFAVWRAGTGGGLPGAAPASASATTSAASPEESSGGPSLTPDLNATAAPIPTVMTASTQSPSPWFRATGSMTTAQPVSTLLADGRVLFVCSDGMGGITCPQAEFYDPATGSFDPAGWLPTIRMRETVTALRDGRALVAGGLDGDGYLVAQAELFDPATAEFTSTGSLTTSRERHTAMLLRDGRVLIAGGYHTQTGEVLASAELYDPKTGKFTPTGSMNVARMYQSATLLADGRVLILGGEGEPAGPGLASAELYDPGTGNFTLTGSAETGSWNHTTTLLADGRVLVTGGMTEDVTGNMTGNMTGDVSGDRISSTAEIYDPTSGKFTPTNSMSVGREEHTATLLPDGRVLITGGLASRDATANAVASTELYDPKTGQFTPAGTMAKPRMGHTATLLADGLVLIAGGTYYETVPQLPPASPLTGHGAWVTNQTAELYQP